MLVGMSLDMVLFSLVLGSVGVLFLDLVLTTDLFLAKVACGIVFVCL